MPHILHGLVRRSMMMVVIIALVVQGCLIAVRQRPVTIMLGAKAANEFGTYDGRLQYRYYDIGREFVVLKRERATPETAKTSSPLPFIEVAWNATDSQFVVNDTSRYTVHHPARWTRTTNMTVDIATANIASARFWAMHWRDEMRGQLPPRLFGAFWSPDGRYAVSQARTQTPITQWQIWRVPELETQQIVMPDSSLPLSNFYWSPDSERIAFVASRSPHLVVMVVGSDGGEPDIVAVDVGPGLVWSPDGAYLAYNRGTSVVIVDTTTWEVLATHETSLSAPNPTQWSADGRWLLIGRGRYDVLNVSSGALTHVGHWSDTIGWVTN